MPEGVLPIEDEDPAGEVRGINPSEPAKGAEGDALRQPRVGKPGDHRCESTEAHFREEAVEAAARLQAEEDQQAQGEEGDF